jgi:hypothetical protein
LLHKSKTFILYYLYYISFLQLPQPTALPLSGIEETL